MRTIPQYTQYGVGAKPTVGTLPIVKCTINVICIQENNFSESICIHCCEILMQLGLRLLRSNLSFNLYEDNGHLRNIDGQANTQKAGTLMCMQIRSPRFSNIRPRLVWRCGKSSLQIVPYVGRTF